ncbi:MAG: aldo/keto reductase, partial [Campylobacteraceae bacterium]
PLYNLVDRKEFEDEYLDFVTKEHILVTSYKAIASGFLSGKYRKESDFNTTRASRGDFKKRYFNERAYKILGLMDEISKESGASLTKIARAWKLSKPYITSAIASATTTTQLKEIIEAQNVKLSKEQLKRLDEASNY